MIKMLSRNALEADEDVQSVLSLWGTKSIDGHAAFVLERMYRADASGDTQLADELRKHIDYFCEKANTDLGLLLHGADFDVDKAVWLNFANNCLVVSASMTPDRSREDKAIESRQREDQYDQIHGALVRIQTQLALNSWVVNRPHEELRKRILSLGALLAPNGAVGTRKIRIGFCATIRDM